MMDFPAVPYGPTVWVEDMWRPDIRRCGEDECGSGEEKSSKSGREFHREWTGVPLREVWEGGGGCGGDEWGPWGNDAAFIPFLLFRNCS